MPRYPHALYSQDEGKNPERVLCLSVEPLIADETEQGQSQTLGLSQWHCSLLTLREGEYNVAWEATGQTQRGYWDTLRSLAEQPGQLWIVSSRAAQDWSILGLWEGLEDESLSLTGTDYRNAEAQRRAMRKLRLAGTDPLGPLPTGQVRKLRRAYTGYLVCEDPPTICTFYLRDCPARVTWIDSRNHGVDAASLEADPGWRAVSLSAWWRSATAMLAKARLGSWRVTAGSLSLSGWRTGYHQPGVQAHCVQEALDLEAESYIGGRCECFRIGVIGEQVWHVDIRSLYPSVCMSLALPMSIEEIADSPERAEYLVRHHPMECVANVRLSTPLPNYPYLRGKDTVWPVGHFHVAMAGPELHDSVVLGRLVSVSHCVRYNTSAWMANFATALHDARCHAEDVHDKALASQIKLLMVCLPGKMGQKEHLWIDVNDERPASWWGEWWGRDDNGEGCRYRSLNGHVQREITTGFAADAVPAAASFITSAGRMRLLSMIRAAGWKNTYYVDTDSLIVNREGLDWLYACGLIRSRDPGFLEIRAGPIQVELRGQKYYVADGKVVCAGMPRVEPVTTDRGEAYYYNRSPREQLQQERRPDAERVLRQWSRQSEYTHGTVEPDGRVSPLVIGE